MSNPSDETKFEIISAAMFCAMRPSGSCVTSRGSRVSSAKSVERISGRASFTRKFAEGEFFFFFDTFFDTPFFNHSTKP